MTQCGRCHHENAPGVKFCGECGARLDSLCPGCQATNPPSNKFCHECGASLSGESPLARFASPHTYTPGRLAKKILTGKAAVAGERKQVTVLFADLKGSLELLADRDPEDARTLLDGVLERMMEAVHRFEGTVNQVMGDGIMALFGAPLAHEDHAVRACYAALRMHRAVGRYAEELKRLQGVDVQIRVGLNSGDVVVRSIGTDLHMDYSAVGQTTHLAARMEQLARPGITLITDATRRLAERHIEVEAHGPVPIKGLRQPVEVYELRDAKPTPLGLQAVAPYALTRFIGREAELAELTAVLERAVAGQGQVVAITGEPGVGKSRFIWEFVKLPTTDGWEVLSGSAVSYGTATPYLPLTELLKGYFQVDPGDDAARIRAKVTARLLALDASLHWAVSPLLSIGNLDTADAEWDGLEPSERRQRIFKAVIQIFLKESEVRPLLLVFENLHWADSETRALVAVLAERLASARILLVVSYRPEHRPAWTEGRGFTHLRLTPFARAGAQALLDTVLGDGEDLEPLKALLVERSGGNPFFLEESVKALTETDVLLGERGIYRLARPMATIQIPDRVQSLLAARVDRLSEDLKSFLQTGAVIGKDVPFALLQAVADLSTERALENLTDLESADFLHPISLFPDLAYSFRHALTHDVVYMSLLKDQRRTLHARIVDALETLYPDRRTEHIERLAHHAVAAELWYEAAGYLREAGAKAGARSANREAVAFYQQALDALRHLPESRETFIQAIDVRLDLRPPLLQLGRLDEIYTLSKDAERMAEQIGDEVRLARAYSYLVNYHYLKGEPDLATEYGTRCLAIAERVGDPGLAVHARRYLGHSYHAQGQHRLAARVLEDNIAALEASPDRQATASVIAYVASCGWLALALADLGEFDVADTFADRARAMAESSRHPYSEAIALSLTGMIWAGRGQMERAVPMLAKSLGVCRETHLTVWQPIPGTLLGRCLMFLDRKDDGLSLLEDSVRLSEDLGVKAYLALWTANLAEGLLVMGDSRRAGAVAARALELARAHKERGHEATALRLLGDVAARLSPGDLDQAARRYRESIALAEELGMRPLCARAHLGLGTLARRAGKRGDAEEHLATAVVLFSELGMRFWLDKSEPELKALGELVIVARGHINLYEYLSSKFAGDPHIRVILDRRYTQPRPDGAAGVGHHPENRRHLAIDQAVRSRGLAVVTAR